MIIKVVGTMLAIIMSIWNQNIDVLIILALWILDIALLEKEDVRNNKRAIGGKHDKGY